MWGRKKKQREQAAAQRAALNHTLDAIGTLGIAVLHLKRRLPDHCELALQDATDSLKKARDEVNPAPWRHRPDDYTACSPFDP